MHKFVDCCRSAAPPVGSYLFRSSSSRDGNESAEVYKRHELLSRSLCDEVTDFRHQRGHFGCNLS